MGSPSLAAVPQLWWTKCRSFHTNELKTRQCRRSNHKTWQCPMPHSSYKEHNKPVTIVRHRVEAKLRSLFYRCAQGPCDGRNERSPVRRTSVSIWTIGCPSKRRVCQNGPVEHEPLEGLDFHSDLLFLDPCRRRWRSARQAVHRRRQRICLSGEITRKVN